MRSLDSAVAAAIDERVLSKVGRLVALTLPDGTVIRSSTFGPYSAEYGGETYAGSIGFDFSEMTLSDGATHPAIDALTAAGSSTPLTFDQAAGGLASGAEVEIHVFLVGVGAHKLGSKWYIAGTALDDAGQFDIDIKPMSSRNRQVAVRAYGPGCKWGVGDANCGVNMAPFTDTVTVVTNADLFTLTVTGGSATDDYYANGAIKFTSGDMAGVSRTVRGYVASSGTIVLAEPLPGNVSASDTATVHAGCDKTIGTAGCARFSNFSRRLAWDHLPDDSLSVPQVIDPPEEVVAVQEDDGDWYSDYEGPLGVWG